MRCQKIIIASTAGEQHTFSVQAISKREDKKKKEEEKRRERGIGRWKIGSKRERRKNKLQTRTKKKKKNDLYSRSGHLYSVTKQSYYISSFILFRLKHLERIDAKKRKGKLDHILNKQKPRRYNHIARGKKQGGQLASSLYISVSENSFQISY